MPKIKKNKTKKNTRKKRVKKIVIKKLPIKKIKTKEGKKTEPAALRIANSNKYTPEDKVEIKKIKKQATEKKLYDVKDFVVYPKHGVGKILSLIHI